MLQNNSRYAELPVYNYNGRMIPATRRISREVQDGIYYTVIEGDTLDLLAYRNYGDERLWWVIADVNPGIKFPTQLEAGSIIVIPQVIISG